MFKNSIRIGSVAYLLSTVVLSKNIALAAPTSPLQTIKVIAPLGSSCSGGIPTNGGGFQIMFEYFKCSSAWLYDVAIGICILWVLIGGIQIIVSGDNSGWYERGKNVIIASIAGLVMLLFAPVILKFLNSAFFT